MDLDRAAIRSAKDVTPAMVEACFDLDPGSIEQNISRAPLAAFATTSRLFRLSARIVGTDARRTLILKLPIGSGQEAPLLDGCYRREVEVYRWLRGLDLGLAPACYSAGFRSDDDFHLLLEDCAADSRQFSLDDSWGEAHLRVLLSGVALLHARTAPRCHAAPDWRPRLNDDLDASTADAVATFCGRFATRLSPFEREILAAVAVSEDALRGSLRGPRVLVHGDLHPLNALFSGPEPIAGVRLIDWQFAGWGVGAADVADTLGLYTPPVDREHTGQDLLAHYLDAWAACGGPGYERTDLNADYRICLLLNLLKPAKLLSNNRLQHGVVLRLFKRASLAVRCSEGALSAIRSIGGLGAAN